MRPFVLLVLASLVLVAVPPADAGHAECAGTFGTPVGGLCSDPQTWCFWVQAGKKHLTQEYCWLP